MRGIVVGVAAAASLTLWTSAALAGTNWPWCALLIQQYGMASNCGFASRIQCESYLSGLGGYCEPNPFYHAAAPRRGGRPARRR
jgi:hypothetical protein